MKVIYVAHVLTPVACETRDGNRKLASQWCAAIAQAFKVAISADWIILSGQWSEDMREFGLKADREMVTRADELWMVGERVSIGMLFESEHALINDKTVRDYTGMTIEQIGAAEAANTTDDTEEWCP